MRELLKRIMDSMQPPQKVKEVMIILLAWLTAIAMAYITWQKFTILFHK